MSLDRLAVRLRSIVGEDGVADDAGTLLAYECDGYTLERAAPELVVLPRTPAETAAVLRVLAERCIDNTTVKVVGRTIDEQRRHR